MITHSDLIAKVFLKIPPNVAAYALVVDAKGEKTKAFYEHYGFTACRDNPMTLYLPLGV